MEIEITKEKLLAAKDYMTNREKEQWVSQTAPKCFDRLEITADGEAQPPMYMVNSGLKARYLMSVFARHYMGEDFTADSNDSALMSEADYDRWAGSHVMNQLDRWKHDGAVRNKCFDLLEDYHELSKRLTAQLNGLLAVQNDTVIRQNDYLKKQTLEALPDLVKALSELQARTVESNASQ